MNIMLLGQENQIFPFGFNKAPQADTLQSVLKLPNPLLDKPTFLLPLSTRQMVKSWIFQRRNKIWSQIRLTRERRELLAETPDFYFNWNTSTPAHTNFNLDYRESSLYEPQIVRYYDSFKKWRSPHVPIFNLEAVRFLYQRFNNNYGVFPQNNDLNFETLRFSPRELFMMDIIWEKQVLNAKEWFATYLERHPNKQMTFLIFQNLIDELKQKALIVSELTNDKLMFYSPAFDAVELVEKLKKKLKTLDPQKDEVKIARINYLIQEISDLSSRKD